MFIILIIFILIIILSKEYDDYREAVPALKNYHYQLVEEGKELKKNAEKEMEKEKCKKGGNCDYILTDTTVEHLYGWDDEITGYYECSKCKNTKDFIIQYPN